MRSNAYAQAKSGAGSEPVGFEFERNALKRSGSDPSKQIK
jgi:hypothetical protein